MRSRLETICLYAVAALTAATIVIVLQSLVFGQKIYPKFPIYVGKLKENSTTEISRWLTEGTFAVASGKDANLYVAYSEDADEFILSLESTKEHAATDGYIPTLKITNGGASNTIRVEARKE